MKRILIISVLIINIAFNGNSQAVEWVTTISGIGSVTYVNDSLIYLASATYCTTANVGCITDLMVINNHKSILNSKQVNFSFPITQIKKSPNSLKDFWVSQQRILLPSNRVLFSQSQFILNPRLDIDTLKGYSSLTNYSSYENVYSDSSKIRISNSLNSPLNFTFYNIDKNGVLVDSNSLALDNNFYLAWSGSEISTGNPFIDKNKSLYFSISGGFFNYYSSNSYIPTNTVGGVLVNYPNQWNAAVQTIFRYNSNNVLELLPFFDKPNQINNGVLQLSNYYSFPEYFQQDSKGNLIILSNFGFLEKYKSNPWDSLWTGKLSCDTLTTSCQGGGTGLYIDNSDNIYATVNYVSLNSRYDTTIVTVLNVIDSLGNKLYLKKFINSQITTVQSDNQQSIYVSGGIINSNSSSYLDCFTVTGNFVAKLYTGTIPSTPKLSLSGIILKSNFPRGVTWYRNDTLLPTETDTTTLALRDGTYTFKSFCKWDTLTFHGINAKSNGNLKVVDIPGGTYQWYLNGVLILNANTDSIIPTSSGKYTVAVTFTGLQAQFASARVQSGTTYTATYSINVGQTVTNITDKTSYVYFVLFPNPASGKVTVKIAGNPNGQQLLAYNSLGQEVINQQLLSDQTDIDISTFYKGIYTIKLGNQVQKLVVE